MFGARLPQCPGGSGDLLYRRARGTLELFIYEEQGYVTFVSARNFVWTKPTASHESDENDSRIPN